MSAHGHYSACTQCVSLVDEHCYSTVVSLLTCRPEPDTEPLISVVEFYQFARHIAVALEFLASQEYVHRDVAARNCLGEHTVTNKPLSMNWCVVLDWSVCVLYCHLATVVVGHLYCSVPVSYHVYTLPSCLHIHTY